MQEAAAAVLSVHTEKLHAITTEISLGSDVTGSGSERGSSCFPSRVCSTPASETSEPVEFWQSSPDVTPCHFPTFNATKSEIRSFSENISLESPSGLASLWDQYRVTPATAIKVGWLLVLQTYTGQNSVCLDTISTNHEEVKTCAFDFVADPEVAEVLVHVQQKSLYSVSQADASAAAFSESFAPTKERICNTAFTRSDTELQGYDILLRFRQSDTDIGVTLVYRGSIISQTQAKRVRATFQKVLQSIVESPRSRASVIQRLSDEDRHQILKWNESLPPILNQSLHHVFSEKALDNPDSLAINAWDGDLTYGELDEASTRLASYIASLIDSSEGGTPRVPFAFEKSKFAIVTILAILKTGSTCVPLDSGGSDRELQERLLAVGAQIVCVSPSKADNFTTFKGERIIVNSPLLEGLPLANPNFDPSSHWGDIAFIEYTAGTNGKPKGVLLGHAALYTGILEQGQSLGYDQNSKVLQHAPYTSSLSIGNIFGAFLYDACLVIPPEEEISRDLTDAIHREEITHACLTPSGIENVRPNKIAHLKGLALVGEPSDVSHIAAWSETTEVVKAYGTTETSVLCTISKWISSHSSAFSNIGKPFASSAWIVNPSDVNQILPIGSVGELILSGPTLADGYLNDQAASANAFFTDPTWAGIESTITQQRFFRTGDLVRYIENGDLELLGRKQDKISSTFSHFPSLCRLW